MASLSEVWDWPEDDAAVQVAIRNSRDAYAYARDLGDGRGVWVMPMITGNGRLVVGPIEGQWLDDAWCYDSVALACLYAVVWDGVGEPEGWKRHIASGRRRPGGDASREYVSP